MSLNKDTKLNIYHGACTLIVTIIGNGNSKPTSNLDEAVCILHNTDILGKGMNLSILPPAMGWLGSLTLVWQLVWEKENSEFRQLWYVYLHNFMVAL